MNSLKRKLTALALSLCLLGGGISAVPAAALSPATDAPGAQTDPVQAPDPAETPDSPAADELPPADNVDPADLPDVISEPAEPDAAPESDTAAPAGLVGDVDGNGTIEAADARYALRIAVGLENVFANDPLYLAADVDASDVVDAADARWILRRAVGLEDADHVHLYENAYCTICGKLHPKHYPLDFQSDFERILYETAHPLLRKSSDELPANTGTLMESAYYRLGKWCCYYTIHHVFRPALKEAGYTTAQINHLAPNSYDSKRLANGLLVANLFSVHVPSLLMDYYLTHPQYGKTYVLREFADDVVTNQIYARSEDADSYVPKVGDVLFLTNKSRTWVQGYPTVDHTAQIIQVYADGSFWCTEGSIVNNTEDPAIPRVREMMYFYSKELGTYKYRYSKIGEENLWMVLMAFQPDLTK